jgi:hypothetical protein
MTIRRINIERVLRERYARHEHDMISRIREVRKLDPQGKFHAFSFDFETIRDLDNQDPVYDALAWQVNEMWYEASWCYVQGMFRGSIVLAVGAVESGLKYRLREAGVLEDSTNATFGTCVGRAKDCGLFPAQEDSLITRSALALNEIRNDIIHANKARRDPQNALSSEGPEHEKIDIGEGIKIINKFRFGAIDALKYSRIVLRYLRRHKMRP